MPDPLNNPLVIQRIAALASTQVVSWGMVVDSNGAQTDPSNAPQPGEISGWPDAYTSALSDWLGWAGSGVAFAQVAKQGWGGGFGLTASTTGMPSHVQNKLLPQTITAGDGVSTVASGFDQATGPGGILYVASGTNAGGAGGEQRVLCNAAAGGTNYHYPYTVNQQLRLVLRMATFATGSGSQFFRPSIRQSGSLTWYGGAPGNVSTITGVDGATTYELDIPAGSGRSAWQCEASRLNTDSLVGPFALYSAQIVNPNVTNGVAVSVLTYQGGLGGVEAATSVLTASDTALAELIQGHIAAQTRLGQTPVYVMQWMHGGNDRNDAGQASYNPDTWVRNGADSNTATGVYNNCLTYYRRMLDIWTRVLGYNADRFFLIAGPYREQAAYISTLSSYETALEGISALYPRTATTLRGTTIYNANVWDDMNWYKDAGGEDADDAHGNRQSYFAEAYTAVAAMKASVPTSNALMAATATSTTYPMTGNPNQSSGAVTVDTTGSNILLPAGFKRSVSILNSTGGSGDISFDRGATWIPLGPGLNTFNEALTREAVYGRASSGTLALKAYAST